MKPKVHNCPSCGAALPAAGGRKSVACSFCGNEVQLASQMKGIVADLIVKREIESLMEEAKIAMEVRRFEAAIAHYDRVLEIDPTHTSAWLGKAYCAQNSTSIVEFHLIEAIECYDQAIATASGDQKKWIINRAIRSMSEAARGHAKRIHKYLDEFVSNRASLEEAASDIETQLRDVLKVLQWTHEKAPEDLAVLHAIVEVTTEARGDLARRFELPHELQTFLEETHQVFTDKLRAQNPDYQPTTLEDTPDRKLGTGSQADRTPGWLLAALVAMVGALIVYLFLTTGE